jgi:hypothetical protein
LTWGLPISQAAVPPQGRYLKWTRVSRLPFPERFTSLSPDQESRFDIKLSPETPAHQGTANASRASAVSALRERGKPSLLLSSSLSLLRFLVTGSLY